VAAHPDDAEIAAGGTIARLVDNGVHDVTALLSLPELGEQGEHRRLLAEKAAVTLGYELRWLCAPSLSADLPGASMPFQVADTSEPRLVGLLDHLIAEVRPTAVVTHWVGDGHVDHRLAARATAAATRRARIGLFGMRPGEMRTPAFMRFAPQLFVDISGYEASKYRALEPYSAERPQFRPVDVAAIQDADRYFGAINGTGHAEAFVVERAYGLDGLLGRDDHLPRTVDPDPQGAAA
jgi:LmbE family N-acetylglucosaminyl deacetylase